MHVQIQKCRRLIRRMIGRNYESPQLPDGLVPSSAKDLNSILHRLNSIPGPLDATEGLVLLMLSAFGSGRQQVVEVGSYLGRSTVYIAAGSDIAGKQGVIAVDMFPSESSWYKGDDGLYHIEGSNYFLTERVFQDRLKRGIYRDQMNGFIDNIRNAGLEHCVTPFRGTSSTYVAQLPPSTSFRMAFIDGDHTYEGVTADIQNITPFIIEGGYMCFHDYCSSFPGVVQAVDEHIANSSAFEEKSLVKSIFIARKKALIEC